MKRNKRETVGIGDIYDICDALNDLHGQISDNRKLIKIAKRKQLFSSVIFLWIGFCLYAGEVYLKDRINELEVKIEEMQETEME